MSETSDTYDDGKRSRWPKRFDPLGTGNYYGDGSTLTMSCSVCGAPVVLRATAGTFSGEVCSCGNAAIGPAS